ncbi:MAG TPA: hypothetical protein VFV50_04015 [Bdellovibrionales bacterium]|nr:hypothetical protein [Bdellovibrionales bacterium]
MNSIFRYVIAAALMLTGLTASAEALKIVDSKKVCMVTNKLYSAAQIPVQVEGKTYYGCCEMCKETLATDVKARQAVDPVSKKTIDKAKAVIAARPDGSVVYFENRDNVAKFKD